MLLNQILFGMMVAEAAICLTISLPFGKVFSLNLIKILSVHIGTGSKRSLVASVILALVTLLFLADVQTCYKLHTDGGTLSDGLRIRLLTAQRDMYISGFVLFLFLMLRLVYKSLATNIHLENNFHAMKRQAESASEGLNQQLAENESIQKQLSKVNLLLGISDDVKDEDSDEDTGEGNGDEGETGVDSKKQAKLLATLVEENANLTTKLESAKLDLKIAENKIEDLKKATENHSSAFTKLKDEMEAVDKHLQSTDEVDQHMGHLTEEQQETMEQKKAQNLQTMSTEPTATTHESQKTTYELQKTTEPQKTVERQPHESLATVEERARHA